MKKPICISCQTAKANLTCAACQEPVCKTCAQFVDETTFELMPKPPASTPHGAYCIQCHASVVQPELDTYEAKVERAKNVSVFLKDQSKEVRLLKRSLIPVSVQDCEDRDVALMHLAFQTTEQGYDTLIAVEIIPKKIRQGTYQRSIFDAKGIPAERVLRKPRPQA